MNRKRLFISLIIIIVLVGLAYLQVRTWRTFNWRIFLDQIEDASWWRILVGVFFVYLVYVLRAVRWAVFLRPTGQVHFSRLTAAQFIGFTGMALLGRPGEFIRPYLIARKERRTFSSQMAVWTVERIFDMGAFTILVALNLLFAPSLRDLPYYHQFRRGGFLIALMVVGISIFAWVVWRYGRAVANWFDERATRFGHSRGHAIGLAVARRIQSFGEGLNTIQDAYSFFELTVVSLAIWLMIAIAYREVAHAFPNPILQHMTISHVLLLMGFSIVGSTVQLPVVGGGSQLMTISALLNVFEVPHELSVSCGMMLWVTTFMAVVPTGLVLTRMEHVSLTKLAAKSQVE